MEGGESIGAREGDRVAEKQEGSGWYIEENLGRVVVENLCPLACRSFLGVAI